MMMLTSKQKIIWTDIAGKVTHEAYLPCQQIKQQPKQTAEQAFLTALYNVGEATK